MTMDFNYYNISFFIIYNYIIPYSYIASGTSLFYDIQMIPLKDYSKKLSANCWPAGC